MVKVNKTILECVSCSAIYIDKITRKMTVGNQQVQVRLTPLSKELQRTKYYCSSHFFTALNPFKNVTLKITSSHTVYSDQATMYNIGV